MQHVPLFHLSGSTVPAHYIVYHFGSLDLTQDAAYDLFYYIFVIVVLIDVIFYVIRGVYCLH